MGLDLSKINAGVTDVGRIVQQGVGIFDQIAQRVTGTSVPQPTTTPATPAVTTPPVTTPAPATGALGGIPVWALAVGAVGLMLLLTRGTRRSGS